ncbi:MFS transporter [Acidisoma sp.]|uniref:MFS transporter n=1 Tax=Acidisoma sp. TaxID=1872115 RepID=UPI003B00140B
MSAASPSRSAAIGLSALNFFVAAVQTGFGPFLPVYLTRSGWTQGEVGLALSLGAIASVASQVPGGFLVDRVHQKRLVCAASLGALGMSALVMALWPSRGSVWSAEVLYGFGAAVLSMSVVALTLNLWGHAAFGERVGTNHRYASLGNAAAAGLFGVVVYMMSHQAVFFLGAAMTVPALASLLLLKPHPEDAPVDHPARLPPADRSVPLWVVFFDLHLHTFALCVALFTLANAAMLPVALNALAARHRDAGFATTGSIVSLQVVVVLFAPWLGRAAERWGRRPVLLVGFAALPLRGLLLAVLPGVFPLIGIELLDGVSAAVIGVMIPLTAADLTRKTGYLNLAIGSFGLSASLGATFSTALAGWIADRFGLQTAFLALSAAGVAALLVVLLAMPETRPTTVNPELKPHARPA